jgi:hypothetical protein
MNKYLWIQIEEKCESIVEYNNFYLNEKLNVRLHQLRAFIQIFHN